MASRRGLNACSEDDDECSDEHTPATTKQVIDGSGKRAGTQTAYVVYRKHEASASICCFLDDFQ